MHQFHNKYTTALVISINAYCIVAYSSYSYSYSTALVDGMHVHSLTHVIDNDMHEWAQTKDII